MIGYLIGRIWNGVLVLFGVVTLVFLIFNLKPGDPSRMLADQRGSEEALANIKKDLGLDLSIQKRYLVYLNDLAPVSVHSTNAESPFYFEQDKYSGISLEALGKVVALKWPYLKRSYRSRRPVAEILAEAFPITAVLALVSILSALVIGLALGSLAAVRKGGLVDGFILSVSAIGVSGPSFFVAVIFSWIGGFLWFDQIPVPYVLVALPLILFLVAHVWRARLRNTILRSRANALVLGIIAALVLLVIAWRFELDTLLKGFTLPGTQLPIGGSLFDLDPFEGRVFKPQHLILPALTLGIRPLSVVVQLTRSSMLEVLSQDHVRTAKAKGLGSTRILLAHGLRNAMIPVVTTISGWLASLLAGAVFVEFVFGWRGLGLEVFNALENEDLPVVMGAVLLFSAIFVTINVLVDLVYGKLDPRVRSM